MAQLVKNLPAMRETWVWSLGWEDPLRREGLPTPVFWPGEFQGLYSPQGCKESDRTGGLSLHLPSQKQLKIYILRPVSSVQSLSHVRLFATSWTEGHQASLSITNSRRLLRLMFLKLVMPSNHLILCHPLFVLPSNFPRIRVFSSESVLCIRWPKYWSFSISPSNEYSGLISFRIDCFDFLAVQGTLKSLLQHHSSKASILRHSAFFIVQLLHPYLTTRKTIALTRWTFVGKVMCFLMCF